MNWATNKISDVEPVATVPQLFTNIPEADFAVADAGSSVTVSGLEGVVLQSNEYVGVIFNKIRTLTGFADPAAEGLTLESSMDGKTWTAYAGEEVPEAAFVRLKNNTSEAIALGADTLALEPAAHRRVCGRLLQRRAVSAGKLPAEQLDRRQL